jgi:hypothetical protein
MSPEQDEHELRELWRLRALIDAIDQLTLNARDRMVAAKSAKNPTEARSLMFGAQSILLSAVKVGEQL